MNVIFQSKVFQNQSSRKAAIAQKLQKSRILKKKICKEWELKIKLHLWKRNDLFKFENILVLNNNLKWIVMLK